MKENRDLDMLENADDNTVELLSEIPVLTMEEKERMLAMSKKKLDQMNKESNINTNTDENEIEVSGVERYHRPKWLGLAAIAASLVLAGGAVGTFYSLSRNHSASPVSEMTENAQPDEHEVNQMIGKYNDLTTLAIGTPLSVDLSAEDKYTVRYRNIPYTYKRVLDEERVEEVKAELKELMTGDMYNEFNDMLFDGELPSFTEIDGHYCFREAQEEDPPVYPMPIGACFMEHEISDFDGSSFELYLDYGTGGDRNGMLVHTVLEDGKWKFSSYTIVNEQVMSRLQNDILEKRSQELLTNLDVIGTLAAGSPINIDIDMNDTRTVETSFGSTYVYNRVTEGFTSVDDVRDYLSKYLTGPMLNEYSIALVNGEKAYFRDIDGMLYYRDAVGAKYLDIGMNEEGYDIIVGWADEECYDILATNYACYKEQGTAVDFRVVLDEGFWKLSSYTDYGMADDDTMYEPESSGQQPEGEFDPANGDPETIARDATAVFNEVIAVSCGEGVEVDENDFIISSYDDQTECVYKRVTDTRFSSFNDLRMYFTERTCQTFRDNLIKRTVGGDDYYGSTVYMENDGKLYCYYDSTASNAFDFTGEVEILNTTEYSISSRPHVVPYGVGGELMLMFLELEDGVWKISGYKYM